MSAEILNLLRTVCIGAILGLPAILVVTAMFLGKAKTMGQHAIETIFSAWVLWSVIADVIFFLIFFLAGPSDALIFLQTLKWFLVVAAGAAVTGSVHFYVFCADNPDDKIIDNEEKLMGELHFYMLTYIVIAYIIWGTIVATPQLVALFWL